MRKKRFLGTLILTLLCWGGVFALVNLTEPNSMSLFLFFLILLFALFLTFSIIFGNSRRGFFAAFYICFLLFLKLIKMANYLNIILLTGLFLTAEVFFSKK